MVKIPEEYECAMCKGVFKKEWSDEEAETELKENFGDISTDDCELVCDDCWNKIRPNKINK